MDYHRQQKWESKFVNIARNQLRDVYAQYKADYNAQQLEKESKGPTQEPFSEMLRAATDPQDSGKSNAGDVFFYHMYGYLIAKSKMMLDNEVSRYLKNGEQEHPKKDPLEWWKRMEPVYTVLARGAFYYIAISDKCISLLNS